MPHERIRIERLTAPTEAAQQILEEYYEAVDVIQRDEPGALHKLIHGSRSGVWLAFAGSEAVGCVVLKDLPSIPEAGECKRLYVKPSARGHDVADLLLDALEEQALRLGMQWMYLDTHDGLKTAIALYERRGYQRCERYNDNPQATVFMRKQLA
ncbi:GNAT family N-acetyltransferase [Silvibacterium acidisoli]|uniref:GNAT family N-acetyltransferase n=1 Tax=Acidobacteriaceae bacterium ZG23-2 TaxID=2883246 RepID=UPI00406CE13B